MNIKTLSILALLLLSSSSMFAGHILGGDLSVQHVAGDQFEVRLTLFRDCNGSAATLDETLDIVLYEEGSNDSISAYTFLLSSIDFPGLGDSCFVPDICLEVGTYIDTISIAPNENGLYLVWERCCRSAIIVNLDAPDDIGIVFVASIPDPALENSSPEFSPYPSDGYFCINRLNEFTFEATDVDGDSLSYYLDNPLYGNLASTATPNPGYGGPKPHNLCAWAPSFSLANVVGGDPVMSVDPITGLITSSPENTGVYAFAILVEEWRDGELIGIIRREISLQATVCPEDVAPDFVDFDVLDTVYFNLFEPNTLDLFIADNITDEIDLIFEGEIFDGTYEISANYEELQDDPGNYLGQLTWDSLGCDMLRDEPYLAQFYAESYYECTDTIGYDTLFLAIVLQLPPDVPTILTEPGTTEFAWQVLPDTVQCFDISTIDGNYQDTMALVFDPMSEILALDEPAYVSDTSGTVSISTEFCWTPDCQHVREDPYTLDFEVYTYKCEDIDTLTYTYTFYVSTVSDGNLDLVPNVVTPNNDGSNDRWKIVHTPDKCRKEEDIQVFNRWGTQVFQTTSLTRPWDADYSDGTYYYLINYEFLWKPKSYKGDITIIR